MSKIQQNHIKSHKTSKNFATISILYIFVSVIEKSKTHLPSCGTKKVKIIHKYNKSDAKKAKGPYF